MLCGREMNCDEDKISNLRFTLGKYFTDKKDKILICIGLNPSTANKEKSDPTTDRIEKVAQKFAYDGFYLINLSCKRETNPKNLPLDNVAHNENLEKISALLKSLKKCGKIDILAAWGNNIKLREYLRNNCCDIVKLIKNLKPSARWFCLQYNKSKEPKHPLFARAEKLIIFKDKQCIEKKSTIQTQMKT